MVSSRMNRVTVSSRADQRGERVHDDPIPLHGSSECYGIHASCVGHPLMRHGIKHKVRALLLAGFPELLCQEFKAA